MKTGRYIETVFVCGLCVCIGYFTYSIRSPWTITGDVAAVLAVAYGLNVSTKEDSNG